MAISDELIGSMTKGIVPFMVNYQGFRASSIDLAREGWTMFASQRMETMRKWGRDFFSGYYFFFTDKTKSLILAGSFKFLEMEHFTRDPVNILSEYFRKGCDLNMYSLGSRIMERDDFVDDMFKETAPNDFVEASPGISLDFYRNATFTRHSEPLSESPMFKYLREASSRTLYVPISVDECLNRILEIQEPEQRIIKDKLASGQIVEPKFSAKIYSLVG